MANENRLIDALGLVIKLAKKVGIMVRNGKPQAEIYSKVLECIAEAPTVDAVEVVHGRWIRYEDEHENSVKYICSNCGDYHGFRNDGGSPFLTSERTFNENFAYCRKCGAKMDGGNEDG